MGFQICKIYLYRIFGIQNWTERYSIIYTNILWRSGLVYYFIIKVLLGIQMYWKWVQIKNFQYVFAISKIWKSLNRFAFEDGKRGAYTLGSTVLILLMLLANSNSKHDKYSCWRSQGVKIILTNYIWPPDGRNGRKWSEHVAKNMATIFQRVRRTSSPS